jgi:hypothetical protein
MAFAMNATPHLARNYCIKRFSIIRNATNLNIQIQQNKRNIIINNTFMPQKSGRMKNK